MITVKLPHDKKHLSIYIPVYADVCPNDTLTRDSITIKQLNEMLPLQSPRMADQGTRSFCLFSFITREKAVGHHHHLDLDFAALLMCLNSCFSHLPLSRRLPYAQRTLCSIFFKGRFHTYFVWSEQKNKCLLRLQCEDTFFCFLDSSVFQINFRTATH